MADSFIRVPPDSTGKLIDTSQLTVGGNDVQRERMIIGDNTDNNFATVTAGGQLQVLADQGTAAALSGAWPVKVTDGTDVLGTATHPLRTDPTGTTVQPVSWTSQTVTVVQATGSSLHTVIDSGTITTVSAVTAITNALPSGSNVIGHVIVDSGSITANAGTNLNTSALQLDATGAALNLAQASTTSGQTGPLVQTATTTAAPSYTTAKTNPLSTDTSGNLRVAGAVTGSGNFTVVQPTGTNLHMVVDSGTITTVSTVTAVTAITNALPAGNNNIGDVDIASSALPTGASTLAEQQTQTASLSVLDDWDESDRAKVNLIVGQAGIAAGTGVDGATVPRVTLATNVALPAGTNVIGHVIADSGSTTAVTGNVSVLGTLTHNNAVPAATNVGVLPALANAAAPTYVEGDQVLLNTDLTGSLRVNVVTGTAGVGGTASADTSAFSIGTGLGTPAMGLVNEISPVNVSEDAVGLFRMSPERSLYTEVRDGGGNERSVSIDSLRSMEVDAGGLLDDMLERILFEIKAMRLAIVSTIVEGGARSEDFEPDFSRGEYDLQMGPVN